MMLVSVRALKRTPEAMEPFTDEMLSSSLRKLPILSQFQPAPILLKFENADFVNYT